MILLLACTAKVPEDGLATSVLLPAAVSRDDGWLRGDLHFHTNYSDDARQQGGDDVAGALRIAIAWSDSVWTERMPQFADDGLDFVALTDHRTVDGWTDAGFVSNDLILVPGEEFGSDGHAGIWGSQDHIPHEPQDGESDHQRMRDAVGEARAQGGLFSVNHPLYSGDLWGWQTTDFDAVEVWNGTWSALAAQATPEQIEAWVDAHGEPNGPLLVAGGLQGGGKNAQALRFWEAWLSLGLHVPPVGGGDRHMLVPAGFPTTFVLTESDDTSGILAGIASGHTFVSRAPWGPQVRLEADGAPMGSALPGATSVTVDWTVARADGGVLRFVEGIVDPSMPDPAHTDVAIEGDLATGHFDWKPPAGGGWLYAQVLDPLPEVDDPAAQALLEFPDGDGLLDLATSLAPLVDLETVTDPTRCDPDSWSGFSGWCMPADDVPLGSFYLPPDVAAYTAAAFEDGVATGYAMGAVSAAFHTAPAR